MVWKSFIEKENVKMKEDTWVFTPTVRINWFHFLPQVAQTTLFYATKQRRNTMRTLGETANTLHITTTNPTKDVLVVDPLVVMMEIMSGMYTEQVHQKLAAHAKYYLLQDNVNHVHHMNLHLQVEVFASKKSAVLMRG